MIHSYIVLVPYVQIVYLKLYTSRPFTLPTFHDVESTYTLLTFWHLVKASQ